MSDERLAVALEYAEDAPRLLAVARGMLYDTMIAIARSHGITIYEDPDLAQVLSRLPPGSEIPVPLFAAVAEVLAYCYRVNAAFKEKLHKRGVL